MAPGGIYDISSPAQLDMCEDEPKEQIPPGVLPDPQQLQDDLRYILADRHREPDFQDLRANNCDSASDDDEENDQRVTKFWGCAAGAWGNTMEDHIKNLQSGATLHSRPDEPREVEVQELQERAGAALRAAALRNAQQQGSNQPSSTATTPPSVGTPPEYSHPGSYALGQGPPGGAVQGNAAGYGLAQGEGQPGAGGYAPWPAQGAPAAPDPAVVQAQIRQAAEAARERRVAEAEMHRNAEEHIRRAAQDAWRRRGLEAQPAAAPGFHGAPAAAAVRDAHETGRHGGSGALAAAWGGAAWVGRGFPAAASAADAAPAAVRGVVWDDQATPAVARGAVWDDQVWNRPQATAMTQAAVATPAVAVGGTWNAAAWREPQSVWDGNAWGCSQAAWVAGQQGADRFVPTGVPAPPPHPAPAFLLSTEAAPATTAAPPNASPALRMHADPDVCTGTFAPPWAGAYGYQATKVH